MAVSQIYDHVTGLFPYFRTAKPGWKNSVRHNLSLNKMFCKLERLPEEDGKGAMWGITEAMRDQLDRDILQTQQRFPQKILDAMKEPDPPTAATAAERMRDAAGGIGQMGGRAMCVPSMELSGFGAMSPTMQRLDEHEGHMVVPTGDGFMHAYQPFQFPNELQRHQQVPQLLLQKEVKPFYEAQLMPQAHLAHHHHHRGLATMASPEAAGSSSRRLSLTDGMAQMIGSQHITINDLMNTETADFFSGDQQSSSRPSSAARSGSNNAQMMADFPQSLYELTAGNGNYDLSRTELSNLEILRMSPAKLGLYSPTKQLGSYSPTKQLGSYSPIKQLGSYSPTKMMVGSGLTYSPTTVLGGSGSDNNGNSNGNCNSRSASNSYEMDDMDHLKMDFNITDLHGHDDAAVPLAF
jgi:hypothetical protein